MTLHLLSLLDLFSELLDALICMKPLWFLLLSLKIWWNLFLIITFDNWKLSFLSSNATISYFSVLTMRLYSYMVIEFYFPADSSVRKYLTFRYISYPNLPTRRLEHPKPDLFFCGHNSPASFIYFHCFWSFLQLGSRYINRFYRKRRFIMIVVIG